MLESSEKTRSDAKERPINQRLKAWHHVRSQLARYAIPDSRFHHDIAAFVPDFQKSSIAIDRILGLDLYKSADAVFTSSDNSLEYMRHRVLKDGKRLLVATRGLRRGFVLIDPRKISEDRYELASCLDGVEKPGIGRHITLAQLQEEGIAVDLFVMGAWTVSRRGIQVWSNSETSRHAWLLLADRAILRTETPFITVVHGCQVMDVEKAEAVDKQDQRDDLQCDYIVTPKEVIRVEKPERPDTSGSWLDKVDDDLMHSAPPLQELKGIKTIERIMEGAGLPQESERVDTKLPDNQEQMGIDIVTRLMKGYKP
jgi:5-formyltetrahydrofolate cyclo-ligase